MKKRKLKLLSLALSVCLTVSSVSVASASAGENVAQMEETVQQSDVEDVQEAADASEGAETAAEAGTDETQTEEKTIDAADVAEDISDKESAESTEDVLEAADIIDTEETVGAPSYTTSVALGEAEWSVTSGGKIRLIRISDGKVYKAEDKIVRVEYASGQYRYYAFDSNGYMLTGAQTVNGSNYYFTVPASSSQTPDNSGCGSMKISEWVNTSTDVWSYYDENGVKEAKTGICEINGKKYYIQSSGALLKSDIVKYLGVYYAFDDKGVMITNGAQTWSNNGKLYYFGSDGQQVRKTGWQYLSGSWYKFKNNYSINTTINGFVSLKYPADGKKYSFFFKNGIMRTSRWYKVSSTEKYYIDAKGRMVTGSKKIKNAKGVAHWYYFRETKGSNSESVGSMVTGWVKINKNWYYYSPSKGYRITGPKVKKIKKVLYAFTQTGKLRKKGFFTVDGKQYYVYRKSSDEKSYVLTNQWIKKAGKYYYAGSDGVITTGWKKIGDYTYYFNKMGVMQTSKALTYTNGKKVYVDDNGRMIGSGWIKIDGYWKYLSSTEGFIKNSSKKIDSYIYYFDSKGRLYQDLRNMFAGRSGSKYKLIVNKNTCVVTVLTTDDNGNYIIPVVNFTCSVGTSSTPTPSGTYTATRSARWQLLMGPSWGQYGTNIVAGIYFHSVAGSAADLYSLSASSYNNLGSPASHGCVRLCVSDAKWVYENCNGSTVVIHDNTSSSYTYNKIKFEKAPVTYMSYSQSYDPTDPAVAGTTPSVHSNPY